MNSDVKLQTLVMLSRCCARRSRSICSILMNFLMLGATRRSGYFVQSSVFLSVDAASSKLAIPLAVGYRQTNVSQIIH